jgi:hypothetical protein
MTRAASVSFIMVLCASVLTAQNGSQNGFAVAGMTAVGQDQVQTTVILPGQQLSCPVLLTARQTPGGDRMMVNGVQVKGVAQLLHLIVSGSNSRRVVAANVTVHGFANKGRMVQTLSTQDSSDAAKTFDVRFPTAPREISADLAVPGLSAVSVIDLNSVSYSDGSTWKLAAGRSCSTRIDPMMLVSGR